MQWRSLKKSFNFVTFKFWNLRSRDSQDLWNLENCCKKIQVEIEILLLKLLRLNKSVKEIIYCWTNMNENSCVETEYWSISSSLVKSSLTWEQVHAARFHELIIALASLQVRFGRAKKKKKFDEQRSLETDKFSKFRDSGEAGEIVYLN